MGAWEREFLNEAFIKGGMKLDNGRKPYIRKIRRISNITVWLVDGEYTRKNICEDFVNYAHHYNLKFIPKNEFWIAAGVSEQEMQYYIDRLLVEYRLLKAGVNYFEAMKKATLAEKRERSKSEIMKKLAGGRKSDRGLVTKVRRRLLKKYSGRVRVWLVNGELVRDLLFIDFGGGGHDRVYNFVPDNEVWIDDDIRPSERKFIILHELRERNLMSGGMDYPHAHRNATEIEDHARHHTKKAMKAIREELNKQKIF
jgi:hypothetical protein